MNLLGRLRSSDRTRRRRKPCVEPLEARGLLTFTLVHHAGAVSTAALAALQQKVAAQSAPPSVPAPTGQPTPHELARETYAGRFKGSYKVGPGRFTNQLEQISSLGYGGSNQAFHSYTNMRITIPKDPNAAVTGVIYIVSSNVATTGTQLILDLTGDPTSKVDGVPTHYTWTVDPASAGVYTNAAGYGTGQGTLDIHFFRPGRGPKPALRSGQLQFSINGLINAGGVFNPIGVLGNLPHQS